MAAVDRAVQILGAFSRDKPVLSLAQLAQETGIYKSTLLRLIGSLLNARYLKQREDGKYQVGASSLHLAAVYQRSLQPAELIQPVLRRLVDATGESASFNIRDGDHRVCLYRENSPNPIRDSVRIGDVIGLDRGAGGKVLMAFTGEPGELCDDIRRHVVLCSMGERYPDTAAVACPVFENGESLAGALTLSGPRTRFGDVEVARMKTVLIDAALDLTHSLGGEASRLLARQRELVQPDLAPVCWSS
ncbi:MAG: IclR family transcriptional regulator [Variovorax sp.]